MLLSSRAVNSRQETNSYCNGNHGSVSIRGQGTDSRPVNTSVPFLPEYSQEVFILVNLFLRYHNKLCLEISVSIPSCLNFAYRLIRLDPFSGPLVVRWCRSNPDTFSPQNHGDGCDPK